MIKLTENIHIWPVVHGSAACANSLRDVLLGQKYSKVLSEYPDEMVQLLKQASEKLPEIHGVVLQNAEDNAWAVADPCDALIEALRQHQHVLGLGPQQMPPKPDAPIMNDPWVQADLNWEEYYLAHLPVFLRQNLSRKAKTYISHNIQELQAEEQKFGSEPIAETQAKHEENQKPVLFLCRMHYVPFYQQLWEELEGSEGLEERENLENFDRSSDDLEKTLIEKNAYENSPGASLSYKPDIIQYSLWPVNPSHLFFTLGELPFYTARYEQNRFDPFEALPDFSRLVKQLFQSAREEHLDKTSEQNAVSVHKIQTALKYLRNLTRIDDWTHPDLFDILTAAKGVFGDPFALKILEAARYYPFFELRDSADTLGLSHHSLRLPGQQSAEAYNILGKSNIQWKSLPLHPDQNPKNLQRRYEFDQQSSGSCSHVPEDFRLEQFNERARKGAAAQLSETRKRSEAFTSSLKDGLDIRETLRNWHTGRIYVRENPAGKIQLDTVVILFDTKNDERYPLLSTWYAEHNEESTLTFYATDPAQSVIGPGIAKAEYGGLTLKFPPRPIPNLFSLYKGYPLWMGLCATAFAFSADRHVTVISPEPPNRQMKELAHKFQRRIIWQPLSKFSSETLRKIRAFHILDNKEVRSIAARFIGF